MVDRREPTQRFAGALATAALVLAVGGCNAASPSATASTGAAGSSGASTTPDPAWIATGSMAAARYGHTATLLRDGRVLVAGGATSDGSLASAELYDPSSGSWTATGNLIEARQHHTATLLTDGTVLVAGGDGLSGDLASAERYDPSTGLWAITGSLHGPRYDHTATLLRDGTVLVTGGATGSGDMEFTLASAELYDPRSGLWTVTSSMVAARYRHPATLLRDGTVLVTGGIGGADVSAELYDPDSRSWTIAANMASARWAHAATLLRNGTLLVTGGCCSVADATAALASAEVYDPTSGLWTVHSSMVGARYGHPATLLLDGRLLVAGGTDFGSSTSGALASAELYDPATGSWSAIEPMQEARGYQTATLLTDGRVLEVGGYAGNGEALASAELFDPGTGS